MNNNKSLSVIQAGFLNFKLMDIKIIKPHSAYPLGVVSVTDERGNYLIRVGVAVVKTKPVVNTSAVAEPKVPGITKPVKEKPKKKDE